MNKTIELQIGDGNLDKGFWVNAAIQEHGKTLSQINGKLPPALEIYSLYEEWKLIYQYSLESSTYSQRGIDPKFVLKSSQITPEKVP